MIVVETSTRLSKKPLRRMPASTPAAMPMTISKRTATMVSLMVTGSVRAMVSETGRPRKSVPRSPWNRSPMYFKYWTTSGSLRLNSSRSCATTAGESGRSPASARMGSPGRA